MSIVNNKNKFETTKQDRRCQTEKKHWGLRSLSSKKDTKISLKNMKEKAEAANKELSQSKGKPSKQKKQQHKQKVRKQKRKQKKQMESSQKSRRGTMWRRKEKQMVHVGHNMDKRKKTAISNEEACREGEVTMEHKREETNGKQTENVIETDCLGEELPEHCTRTDEEAGSIVLHVGPRHE